MGLFGGITQAQLDAALAAVKSDYMTRINSLQLAVSKLQAAVVALKPPAVPPATNPTVPPAVGGTVIEALSVTSPLSGGFTNSIEGTDGSWVTQPGGVLFTSPPGNKRVEVAASHPYNEGDTVWGRQVTTLAAPWPDPDPDTNFMNWTASDGAGFGANMQVAIQASGGVNRLHVWLYPLGSATRTGAMNWNAALVYDMPAPAVGTDIDVTVGLKLSSDPTVGWFEVWINGQNAVPRTTGRTLFKGCRMYGKAGIYGGPYTINRALTLKLWQMTTERPF